MAIVINGDNNANTGGVAYGAGSTMVFSASGTAGQVLVSDGTNAPTWDWAPAAGGLAGGVAGAIPYQSATGVTGFSAAGTSGQVLTSTGASAPIWGTPSSATTATNLAGGSAGVVPVQTGSGSTSFTSVGTSGQVLTSAGTSTPTWSSAGDASTNIGYLNIPQNSQSAAYTLVLADSGKSIYHPSADTTARTWTIPANASVAYPIGTAITFINDTSAGAITISITSDTLVLAGTGSTGSRTLAASGMATAIKMTSTRWMISGSGLT